jgi:DNA end-binding protein Ku
LNHVPAEDRQQHDESCATLTGSVSTTTAKRRDWYHDCSVNGMPATVWKGYISFGLVSFPVRLSAAARAETVHFHMLHEKDLSRVKEVFYCAAEEKPLSRKDIVKGYEYEKGKYVVVTEEDLEKIAPPTARNMEIIQFVKSDEVDPIFLEKSYYVAPEEDVSKPYALLAQSMRATGYDAVAKVAMHGREHVVIIRATDDGLVLHTMYFVDELHAANKVTTSQKDFNKRELELSEKLIQTLAAPFRPKEFHDQYRENVAEMIQRKRKGQKIKPAAQPKVAPVVSIMDALKKSLAQTSAGKKTKTTRKTVRKRTAA